jgi:hypothetical protein
MSESAATPAADDVQPSLHVGDHVEDREDSDATMLVVGTPPRSIAETPIDGEQTVADVNPECDPDEPVVNVVFPSRTDTDLGALQQYGYPRSRLQRVEAIHTEGDDE